jgi:hypothetical protein
MAQSFSLANMTPQAPKNNREAWSSIESATRKYAMRAKGDVYVISGPVFSDRPQTIGAGRLGAQLLLQAGLRPQHESRLGALDCEHQRGSSIEADQLSRSGETYRHRILLQA